MIQAVCTSTILVCQHYHVFDMFTSFVLQLGVAILVFMALGYKVNPSVKE